MAKSSGKAGSLFYGMTLDTKEFKKKLKDARKALKSAGEEMRETISLIGNGLSIAAAAVAGVTGGMLAFAKSTAEANNEQILLAESIGATQSEIAGLELATEKWGVETDMVIDKMREVGGIDEFAKLADDVKNAGDEQAQLNKAVELFGGEGAKMLTVLQQGSAGLRAMEQEAIALGLALSPQQIQENNAAWGQFEDTLQGLKGLGKQIGTGFNEMFGTVSAGVDGLIQAFGTDIKEAFQSTSDFITESMSIAFQWFADNGIPFINAFISFANQIGDAFSTIFNFIRGEGGSTFSFIGSLFDGMVDFLSTFKQTFISGVATAIATVIDGAFSILARFSDFLGSIVVSVASGLEAIGLEEEGFADLVKESFDNQGNELRNVGKEWADGLRIVADEQSQAAADILEDQRKKNEGQAQKFKGVIEEFTFNFTKAGKVAQKTAEATAKAASTIASVSQERAGLAVTGSQEEFAIRQSAKQTQLQQQQLSEAKKTRKALERLETV